MFYSKQIKYLDVYEKGEKVQNAGFVRLEVRENVLSMHMKAEKLRHGDVGTYTVVLRTGEWEAVLGEIHLEKGCGTVSFTDLQVKELAGDIAYEELEEIYVKLPGGRILRCIIRESRVQEEVTANSVESDLSEGVAGEAARVNLSGSVAPEAVKEGLSKVVPAEDVEAGMRKEASAENVKLSPEEDVSQKVVEENMRRTTVTEKIMESQSTSLVVDVTEEGGGENTTMPRPMSEPGPILRPIPVPPQQMQEARPIATEKWQQLWEIYPHIRPFEDGRDYLKLRPEDLVLLTRRYYPLVSNSFLRHGFYNYGHLILTREKRPEGERFFIGVPGNFYEKEKQVAVLYGFESFEGKQEPARNGDFGYYMISVEI